MELLTAIKERRSVRRFKPDDVDENTIRKIIEVGIMAPSAGNLQGRDFYIVRGDETQEKLAKAAWDQESVKDAPVSIIICCNHDRVDTYGSRGIELYAPQDCAAAAQNMLLYLHSLGLATCWVGAFDEEKISDILNLEDHLRPVIILPVGYPDQKPKKPKLLPFEEVVHEI
jgi:nitroreductase